MPYWQCGGFAKDFNKNPRKAVDGLVDDGKDYFDDLKDDTQEKVDDLVEQGKDLITGVEKDIRKLVEDLADTSKRLMDKITLREAVEKQVKEQIQKMPKQMKLASKKDVQNLSAAVKALTAKVEEMGKKDVPEEKNSSDQTSETA